MGSAAHCGVHKSFPFSKQEHLGFQSFASDYHVLVVLRNRSRTSSCPIPDCAVQNWTVIRNTTVEASSLSGEWLVGNPGNWPETGFADISAVKSAWHQIPDRTGVRSDCSVSGSPVTWEQLQKRYGSGGSEATGTSHLVLRQIFFARTEG